MAQTILDSLAEGLPRRVACARAGISDDTLARWAALYADFKVELDRADAEAIARNVATIQKAATDGTWQAAAWWLERRYPQEFGRLERLQIDVELRREADRIAHERGLDPAEVMAEAQRMLKASK